VSWQVQQSIHYRDRDLLRTIGDSYDVIAGTDFSFFQNAKVKPWSSVRDEEGRHAWLIHADADAVAGHAWLCDFKYRISNPILITDADFIVSKSLNCEVLAELAESEIIAAQKALPVIVGVHLVDEYGTLFPSVTCEIRLRVAIEV
jgi:hypothetical protein